VEVDEAYIGGEEPGLRGGRARGKKVRVGVAVEIKEPRGIGRCRMANWLTAAMCAATGGQPAAVCAAGPIPPLEAALPTMKEL
jgi:hypothetical protein